MTENEAKTKWCPFARDRDGSGNRAPYGDSDAHVPPAEYTRNEAMAFPCLGSDCMAWRWGDVHFLERETGSAFSENAPGRDLVEPGFCGLAGRP